MTWTPTTTPQNVTDAQIAALLDESRGIDPKMVAICRAALKGNARGRHVCADVIGEAEAMLDPTGADRGQQ